MTSMPRIRFASGMRRWFVGACAILVVASIALVVAWPALIHHLVISRLQAMTHRPVDVASVQVNPFTGRVGVQGLRVFERDGGTLFTDFDRLDLRVKPLALLGGHLWIRDAVLQGSTVRVVRFGDDFNFSDLVKTEGPSGRALDVTVDRFVVTRGTVTLEDRALSEPRTWRSEGIEIEAHNLSTRRDDGSATARSVTAGAPVSLEMKKVRLHPIHLEAVVATSGLDLGLARLYFPPDSAVVLERGRASSTIDVVLDAKGGLRANATGEMEDVVLARPGEREPAAVVPKVTLQLSDLLYQDDRLAIGRFDLTGSASVRDPSAGRRGRYQVSTLRASIADVTWPVTAPGRLDVESSVPGGGSLKLTGSLRPPPAASQLKLRLASVDLAPWAHLVPVRARVAGIAEADLSINEPLAPGVPNRIQGSVAVRRLGIGDARRELIGADRVEASGFDVHWPTRLAVKRLVVSSPRATIERDKAGELPLRDLFAASASASIGPGAMPAPETRSPAAAEARAAENAYGLPLAVTVGEIVVNDGRVAWRDEAVSPRASLDFAGIEVAVTGATWPVRGPLTVRASVAAAGRRPGAALPAASASNPSRPTSASRAQTPRSRRSSRMSP